MSNGVEQILNTAEEVLREIEKYVIDKLMNDGRLKPTIFLLNKTMQYNSKDEMLKDLLRFIDEKEIFSFASEVVELKTETPNKDIDQMLLSGEAERKISTILVFSDASMIRVYNIVYSNNKPALQVNTNIIVRRSELKYLIKKWSGH